MTDIEIIENLKRYYNILSTNAFAKYLGLKNAQTLYDVLKGRNGISKELAEIIIAKCLEINSVWVKTGEGPMEKTNINNENSQINPQNNKLNQEVTQMEESTKIGILEEAIDIMKKELHDKQRTIDQLSEANRELISYVTGSQQNKKKEAV